MGRMFDMIRQSNVPAAVIRTAARGGLSVAPEEMLEILVYLTSNPVVGQQARMTLAEWEEKSARETLASSAAPPEVLSYYWAEENRRLPLMRALIDNPAIDENLLMELAGTSSREILEVLLASSRVRHSPALLEAVASNYHIRPGELEQLQQAKEADIGAAKAPFDDTFQPSSSAGDSPYPEFDVVADPETEAARREFELAHASEIAAEAEKPFELMYATADERNLAGPAAVSAETQAEGAGSTAATAIDPKTAALTLDDRKLSTFQRIAKMGVSGRVKVAFTGNKEERAILIRDGSKVVQNAVLASPKLTEPEVEVFSAAKNLQENVLREISRNRKFMKNYSIIRNLVNNPRCPLDVGLTLVKNLLVGDLKTLQSNKNVSDTIRKIAIKLYKDKSVPAGQR